MYNIGNLLELFNVITLRIFTIFFEKEKKIEEFFSTEKYFFSSKHWMVLNYLIFFWLNNCQNSAAQLINLKFSIFKQ